MNAMGTMRDLDQIREHDEPGGSSKLMSIALGGLATACVLFAIGVLVGREAGDDHRAVREDPLARLDHLAQQSEPTPLTYPERLAPNTQGSADLPTPGLNGAPAESPREPLGVTARSPRGASPLAQGPEARTVMLPSSAPSRLAPVELGASSLGAAALAPVMHIRDAAPSPLLGGPSPVGPSQGVAPVGSDGAFTVQVSSFRTQSSAQAMAQRLREHGHRAYVASPATAPNGVVWHRVRVGPFSTQREAAGYRADFETRERAPAMVVRRDVTTVIPAHITP